jgi:multisubunit Na+/H+ antiporter MnhB subunit
LMAHDLKAMLAFSTISQLGFLIGIYGLGAGEGVRFDFLHIFNHVLYKGSLFMVAGIVDHSTGTRDIRKLGGLRAQMPLLAFVACVSCAAMAGLPGTTGFLSKETILAALLGMTELPGIAAWIILFAVAFVAVLKVIFGLRFAYRIFFGRNTPGLTDHLHAPSFGLQVPPLILASMALTFGIFPGLMQQAFDFLAVTGLHAATTEKLVLWHGVTPALIISIIVVISGCLAWWTAEKRGWFALTIPRWARFDLFFEEGLYLFSKGTKTITKALRADAPLDYLPILIGFSVALVGGYMLWNFGAGWAQWVHWNEAQVGPLRSFVAALIALSVVGVLVLRRWTTQLIVLSVAGFLTAFYFVLYHAPDLALTQLLVEAVTLLLILLLLGRFPKSAERGERTRPPSSARTVMNIALSLGVGAIMTVFVLTITGRPHPEPIGPYFLENTVELAEGSNAVNTILVDFRGIDTLGEITVLVIAMLGCLGLLMRYKRTPEEYRRGSLGPAGSGGPHKES